jgi:hypothetical protein
VLCCVVLCCVLCYVSLCSAFGMNHSLFSCSTLQAASSAVFAPTLLPLTAQLFTAITHTRLLLAQAQALANYEPITLSTTTTTTAAAAGWQEQVQRTAQLWLSAEQALVCAVSASASASASACAAQHKQELATLCSEYCDQLTLRTELCITLYRFAAAPATATAMGMAAVQLPALPPSVLLQHATSSAAASATAVPHSTITARAVMAQVYHHLQTLSSTSTSTAASNSKVGGGVALGAARQALEPLSTHLMQWFKAHNGAPSAAAAAEPGVGARYSASDVLRHYAEACSLLGMCVGRG